MMRCWQMANAFGQPSVSGCVVAAGRPWPSADKKPNRAPCLPVEDGDAVGAGVAAGAAVLLAEGLGAVVGVAHLQGQRRPI